VVPIVRGVTSCGECERVVVRNAGEGEDLKRAGFGGLPACWYRDLGSSFQSFKTLLCGARTTRLRLVQVRRQKATLEEGKRGGGRQA
jgi:hypothetical protein